MKKVGKNLSIIKTVIFCGAQNIPLRGHRYDGDLQTDPEKMWRSVVEMPLPKKSLQISITQYFTIMADETTDISIKEQLAICIRYFDTTSYEVKVKFFKHLWGNIARTILQELDRLNLDISYCCSQAYDGGSYMSGKIKDIQARIAKYSHCANYRLNLAISKACSVVSIRNAFGVISSVSNFFHKSAPLIHKLETEVQYKLPHLKKGKTCP
ncbi:hypothetical protein PR048_013796 [Dryococelus australis]|uniref:DUF4371 domain-containing protein n=1 Tax=Dryococelus australis TaxID=614101 RepID=A0ABQ9HT69_9NEOP|nr:hypothetical protein PR048_013796 [Dryococelus australis]